MYKSIVLIVAFFIFPASHMGSITQAQEASNYSSYPQIADAVKQAEEFTDSVFSARKLPGISVAVTLGKEIIWQKAIGMADLENNIPASVNTIYRIQSITKIFTATRLMQLRDEGILHLDDPVIKYLPYMQLQGNKNVSFKQILSHVAGLPNEAPKSNHWSTYKFPDYDEYKQKLMALEAVQPPFVDYKYSNLGFNIIGMAVAAAGNNPYENQIDKYILKPLGMKRSGFSVSPEFAADLAVGYELSDEKLKQVKIYSDMGAVNPSGGLYSTVIDMAHFLMFQFSEKNDVLSVTSRREMRTPHFVYQGWWGGTGLSWHLEKLDGFTVFTHGGGAPGYVAQISGIDELKLGLVLCINSITNQHDISKELLAIFVSPVKELSDELEAESYPLLGPEAVIYEGVYYMGETPILRVWFEDKRLWAIQEGAPEGNEFLFVPGEKEHHFKMQGGPLDGEKGIFLLDSSGRVISLEVGSYKLTPEK
ncbi:MAG: serine hydrolase [Bacteroidales bacterium]|nr:MAG: serine hydrolase [Bacteroidales bacterium]